VNNYYQPENRYFQSANGSKGKHFTRKRHDADDASIFLERSSDRAINGEEFRTTANFCFYFAGCKVYTRHAKGNERELRIMIKIKIEIKIEIKKSASLIFEETD